jgi:hypothetical protein
LCKPPEEQAEDHHQEERLDDRPEKTECSLFVPDFQIPRNKTIEQFTVFPDLTKIYGYPFPWRADFYDGSWFTGSFKR